jgi:hypothetical protein
MDGSTAKSSSARQSWAFMTERMPRTVARIKEARQRGEGPHVDLCWRRGVQGLEPGWFWAYEAGVSVGVPCLEWLQDPVLQQLLSERPGLSVFMLRDRAVEAGAADGAH